MDSASFTKRLRIISVCVFFFAFILITKIFLVSVVHKKAYTEKAERQYSTSSSNVFNRGTIFFSTKDGNPVAAGAMSSGFKVALSTSKIVSADKAYEALAPYLKIDKDTFMARATKKNDPYEEVAIHLTLEQANAIDALKIEGVSIFKDNWRSYPGQQLAAHTLGFLAFKENNRVGQYGLERYYDKVLSKPNDELYVNFFAEVFADIKEVVTDTKKGDIVTTIEPTVQQNVEEQLKATLEKWNAEEAGAIVIDPKTGEIYSIALLPTFDLNNFGDVKNLSVYRNTAVENVYEFGSVIKPLVIAAAINEKKITPESTYFDSGQVTVNTKKINNFDKKGRGKATMQMVLDQSLNTGMVYVQQKMGNDKFREYMKAYGLGEKTGIDLPNETSGLIKNLESPRDIEYANASFGQGIAMTPIEAVRAFSSLANGGYLIQPHLVKQIRYETGLSKNIEIKANEDAIITKETSETITRMLVHDFETYDNGGHKIEHYSVASKTGTAQVAIEGGGGYYTDRHTHSFFGYFPAYNPKFLVFMYLKNPKGVKYASQTLIPPFVNLTNFLLNYYNVPPDR